MTLSSTGGCFRYVAAAALLLACGCVAADVPLRSGFIEVEGGPVWYEIAGSGDGVPLLTLHGGARRYVPVRRSCCFPWQMSVR